MKKIISLFVIGVIASGLLLAVTAFGTASDTSSMQRIVCFKFKATASEKDIQQHIDDFAQLGKDIPEVLSYKAGKTIHGDFNAAPEYDIMHYMTFKDEEAIDKYFNNPKHKEFIKRNKGSWEKVLVINSNTDK